MNRLVSLYCKIIAVSFVMNLTLLTLIFKVQVFQLTITPEASFNTITAATPKLLLSHVSLSFFCLPFFLSRLRIVTGLNEVQRRVLFFCGPFFLFISSLVFTHDANDILVWVQFVSSISLAVYAFVNSAEIEFDF